MIIKVCGLRKPEQIETIAKFVDLIGMIFYSKSPRFISEFSSSKSVKRVGVFVDEKVKKVIETIELHELDCAQLHGKESPKYCEKIRKNAHVIKAFGIDDQFNFSELSMFEDSIDYFLFDTKTPKHGGSGKIFDWNLLKNYRGSIPFFVSGGINSNSVNEIKKIKHKQFIGVDLNSGFELSPAVKNIEQLKKFIDEIR